MELNWMGFRFDNSQIDGTYHMLGAGELLLHSIVFAKRLLKQSGRAEQGTACSLLRQIIRKFCTTDKQTGLFVCNQSASFTATGETE